MTKHSMSILLFCFIFSHTFCEISINENPSCDILFALRSVDEGEAKQKDDFRDYEDSAPDSVRDFYRINHQQQTYDFVENKIKTFGFLNHCVMSIWDAMRALDNIVDESDPDLQAAQFACISNGGGAA